MSRIIDLVDGNSDVALSGTWIAVVYYSGLLVVAAPEEMAKISKHPSARTRVASSFARLALGWGRRRRRRKRRRGI
jgi:hypothetical protein